MKDARGIGLALMALVTFLTGSAYGFSGELQPGVVVETITKNLEADKAGLQPGDLIVRWTRPGVQATIESPFDLSAIEIEQAPRGSVILEGLRGAENHSWTLGVSKWGVQVRPQLPEARLRIYLQAQEMAKAGKLEEAAEKWRTAAAQVKDASALWFLYQIASMWADARRWNEADNAYQLALDTAADAGPVVRAQLFSSWGDTYRNRNDWQNAEACYQRAIAENQKLGGGSLAIARSLGDLGYVSRRRGDLVQAEKFYHKALGLRQELAPGSLDVATGLNSLGVVAWMKGDLAKAEDYHHQALAIRTKLAPRSLDVADSLNNLGLVAWDRGDLAKANEYFQHSLDITQEREPDSLAAASTLYNLGLVAGESGDLKGAENYQLQALGISQKLAPGTLDVALHLDGLGNVARLRGDLAKAEYYLHQALDIRTKLAPRSLDVADSLNNLGVVAWDRGDVARAANYYRQAVDIRRKLAPISIGVAKDLVNLGNIALQQRNLARAEGFYREAMAMQEKLAPASLDLAGTISNLGEVARGHRDMALAEKYYHLALDIQQKVAPESMDAAESYGNLADLASARRDLAKADEYYRKALTITSKLAPWSKDQAESLASLAGVMRRKGQLVDAARLYEQALNAVEGQTAQLGGTEETSANFRAHYSDNFADYIDLLMIQNKGQLAFQVAERWRARSLLETLAGARVDVRQGIDPALRENERSLQESLRAKSDRRIKLLTAQPVDEKQVTEVEREIADLRSQYNDVLGRIRTTSPVYAALTQPQPLNATTAQQLLDDDTLLLEYALGNERSYVWVVTRSSLTGYELPPRSKVENLARQLYKLVSVPSSRPTSQANTAVATQAGWNTTAAALSRMLLGPVASRLPGKRLLIVGDGTLQYIPFALLPIPGKATGVPLIVEHEIVYAPSASVVAELRREAAGRTAAPKAVAVLADPVFTKEDPRVFNKEEARVLTKDQKPNHRSATGAGEIRSWPNERLTRSATDVGLARLSRLAFSHREADAIMAVTLAGQGKEALGFEANRETATSQELAQYRIVHFATHALSDSRRPELSGLVLSLVDREGKPQDGFLDLQGIYNLNLPAELVVLSACQTALGKEVAGEGLMGLTRGFMYAGATRVMASLWNVDDVSTKMLMERFYRAIEQEGMSPATALRAAQIAMWKQPTWRDPFYWAAFEIQGDWK